MKFLTQPVLFLVIAGVLACFVPFNVEGQDLYHVLTEAIKDVNSMKESLECPLHLITRLDNDVITLVFAQ